jgi:hypothetical protein
MEFYTINAAKQDTYGMVSAIMNLTSGKGVDCAVEG